MKHYVAFALFVASTPMWAAPACNNANLLDLIAKGVFSEQILITAVNNRSDCTFDVAELKERIGKSHPNLLAAIETKVATAALGGGSQPASVAPAQPSAATPYSLPMVNAESKVYVVADNERHELEQQVVKVDMDRGFMGLNAVRLKGPDKTMKGTVPGKFASVTVKPTASLHILANTMMMGKFALLKVERQKNRRVIKTMANQWGRIEELTDSVELLPPKQTPEGLLIAPKQPLAPGGYALQQGETPAVWTFEVSEESR